MISVREEAEKRERAARKSAVKPEIETHLSKPLNENINRLVLVNTNVFKLVLLHKLQRKTSKSINGHGLGSAI